MPQPIEMNMSLFVHILLDSEGQGLWGVQGNTFVNTVGYFNQYIDQLPKDVDGNPIIPGLNNEKLATLSAALVDLAKHEAEQKTTSIEQVDDLIADGTLDGPGMWTFVLGVKYGFAATPETLLYARNLLPQGAIWSAFGLGRSEFPIVAQSWLYGGHVRVGMEDNIYLEKGVLAESNAQLVAKAADIIKQMGGQVATAAQTRDMLNLKKV